MTGAGMLSVGAFEVGHETLVERLVWKTESEKRKAGGQVPKPPFQSWKDGFALQGT